MGRYADNIKNAQSQSAQAAKDAAQSAAIADILTQGAGAPDAAPKAKNLLYFDTTTQKLYVSTGTTASTDWKNVLAPDPV